MKSAWNSAKAAFAMFSKIPMPVVDWNKENLKYMMCFFPFIGGAIGILTGIVYFLAEGRLENTFLAVILTLIPVLVTGGIHVDGLLDTSDALSSWQERTRRLEILKDSHAGAFAVITGCVYFLLCFGGWSQVVVSTKAVLVLCFGYLVSRCLSGIGVITFPKARTDGTVAEFSRDAADIFCRNVLLIYLVILLICMAAVEPLYGIAAFVTALVVFWWYHHTAMKYFGGTTGDLSGFFLCICEAAMTVVLALLSGLC